MKTLITLIVGLFTAITPEESIRNTVKEEYSYVEHNIENIIYCENVIFSDFLERIVLNLKFEKRREIKQINKWYNEKTIIKTKSQYEKFIEDINQKYYYKIETVNNIIKHHFLTNNKIKIYEVVIHFSSCENIINSFFYLLDENNNVFGIFDKTLLNAVIWNKKNNFII